VVAEHAFILPEASGRMFLQGGAPRLARDAEILSAAPEALLGQWEESVRQAVRTKVAVEDEIQRATNDCTDRIKRTHDYEPFLVEYVNSLHKDGFLNTLLDNGKASKKAKSNGGKAKDPENPTPTMKTVVSDFEDEEMDQTEPDTDAYDDDEWKPSSRRK